MTPVELIKSLDLHRDRMSKEQIKNLDKFKKKVLGMKKEHQDEQSLTK